MTYLENEREIGKLTTFDTLTNYRITDESGKFYKISIFLEKISSIEAIYKDKPFLILLGILLIPFGLVVIREDFDVFGILAIIIGIGLIIYYFLSRKHIVIISSDGGRSIKITVTGISPNTIEDYITKIQAAKLKRINSLFNKTSVLSTEINEEKTV